MTWRVDSKSDQSRWVVWENGGWRADAETEFEMRVSVGSALRLTPTGPNYVPTGPDDEFAWFRRAWQLVPDPVESGDTPELPEAYRESGRTAPAFVDGYPVVY